MLSELEMYGINEYKFCLTPFSIDTGAYKLSGILHRLPRYWLSSEELDDSWAYETDRKKEIKMVITYK